MTDLPARPERAATSREERLTALHEQCREDYTSTAHLRDASVTQPLYGAKALAVRDQLREHAPTADLEVAVRVAQRLVDSDNVVALQEALRLLLRAVGADTDTRPADEPPAVRCPAAHIEDPTPCDGPIVVTVLDRTNAGVDGCEHHATRLLASLDGGRVYPLPHAPEGAAIRVFKASGSVRPFPWIDAPRTRPEQLSHDENRRRGDSR